MATFFLYQESLPWQESYETLRSTVTDIEALRYGDELTLPKESSVYLMLDDETFIDFVQKFSSTPSQLFIIPCKENPLQQEAFAIPPQLSKALALYTQKECSYIDTIVRCNETVALGCVRIGKSEIIKKGFFSYLQALSKVHLLPLHIATKEGQEIQSATLFIEAGNEATLTKRRLAFFKASDNQCSRIAAVIYAPRSLIQALRLRFFRHNAENQPLPDGIGVLKSQALHIASLDGSPLDLHLNTKLLSTKTVELVAQKVSLRIATGSRCVKAQESKESIRIQKLPTSDELINFYAKKHLPLLPIADEQDFAELFSKLRQNAKMGIAYSVLLIISVLMATTGLFQNAAPTIIGAMILAPLMGPIVALAMAAVRFDGSLFRQSIKTLIISLFLALMLSATFAYLLPFFHVTNQMAMRTHPTLLDLAVAILAGIAAAYGYANSKVGESLAGVAIAVALVPPLCVAGIGIGWADWGLFMGSFLLFLANVIGIIVAAGVVFYLMGFASQKYAAAAFFIKILMLSFIIIPLWLSTQSFVAEEQIYQKIATLNKNYYPKHIRVKIANIVQRGDILEVEADVIVAKDLNSVTKKEIIRELRSVLPTNAVLIIRYEETYN